MNHASTLRLATAPLLALGLAASAFTFGSTGASAGTHSGTGSMPTPTVVADDPIRPQALHSAYESVDTDAMIAAEAAAAANGTTAPAVWVIDYYQFADGSMYVYYSDGSVVFVEADTTQIRQQSPYSSWETTAD